jgi:hypothetical protein
MPLPHQFLAKDAEMNGHLKVALKRWRRNGYSYRDISLMLSANGLYVSRSAVDSWCKELRIAKGKPSL